MNKIILILLFIFIITGSLTDCAEQEVCMNEMIKDRVIIEEGDQYKICANCSCSLNVRDSENNNVTYNKNMTYIDSGYFGYRIDTDFYPNKKYTAYISCTLNTSMMGSTCINFNTMNCAGDDSELETEFDIGSEIVGGGLDLFLSVEDYQEFFEKLFAPSSTVLTYIGFGETADVYSGYWSNLGLFLNDIRDSIKTLQDFTLILLTGLITFILQPTEYTTDVILPYLGMLLFTFIISNSIFFVAYEMFALGYVISKKSDSSFFEFIEMYGSFHIKTLDFVLGKFMFLFNVSMRILELGLKVAIDFLKLLKFW